MKKKEKREDNWKVRMAEFDAKCKQMIREKILLENPNFFRDQAYLQKLKTHCPNCDMELTEKNHCNLCGWERNVCIYDDNLKCPTLSNNGSEYYEFCKSNSCSHYNREGKRSRTIPKAVQREVWRRDMGRCVECRTKERLEYDHIIPFSKGGSNTVRNIQLLCEKCNRSKYNRI